MRLLMRLLKRRRAVMPPVLSARIVVGEDDTYGVRIRGFHERVGGEEYLRFLLHYYAEVLYYCAKGPRAVPATAETLQTVMRRVGHALTAASGEALTAPLGDALTIKDPSTIHSVRQIRTTLFRDRLAHRQLAAEFLGGVEAVEAATTVFAVLHECLRHLRDDERVTLGTALINMDRMYASGYAYWDLENVSLVPNEALGLS